MTIYSRYLNEPSADRRQVYFGQICDVVIRWCTSYLGIKAQEMGIEIYSAVQRLVKEKNTNVPKEANEFFRYLKTVLYAAEKEYYRNFAESSITIPRDIRKRLKNIDEIITAKESNAGRKLFEDERRQCISEWFGIAEYTALMNLRNTGSLDFTYHDDSFSQLDLSDIKDALEQVLQDTQGRTRECYRALFTGYCIDKSINFDSFYELLNNEIVEEYRISKEKPTQNVIYLKYHPGVTKNSAEASASKMVKDLLNRLRAIMKEKKLNFILKPLSFCI